MNVVAMWLLGASVLMAAALVADAILARRRSLAMSALWNAVLVAALAIGPAAWLLPRWELPLLPAEQPPSALAGATTAIPIDGAGRVAAGPPPQAPRTVQLPSGNYVAVPPLEAFAPLAVPARPARWPYWDLDLAAVAVVLYVFGVAILLLRLLANLIAVDRLRRSAQSVTGGVWLARFEHWRRSVAPWRAVALLVSDEISVPIVLGWRRPAIAIPTSLAGKQNYKTIDAVLVHELAHVERGDCGWQLVERVAQAVYWFHPLIWLASRRIAAVRERACDDFAIHVLADREAYAGTLLEMAARLARRQRLGLAMAVVRTTRLEQRLTSIEHSTGSSRVRLHGFTRTAISIALLALVATAFGVRLVRAEAEPAPQVKSTKPAKQQLEPAAPRAAPGEAASEVDDLFKDINKTEQDEDVQFYDHLKDEFPQAHREAAKKLFVDLLEQKYDRTAGLFAPQLRDSLSAERLQAIFESLSKQFGKLQPRATLHSGRLGNRDLPELILNFGRQNVISLRLLFDEHDKLSGLWIGKNPLVADDRQPRFEFGAGAAGGTVTFDGIAFGEPMQELAKANLSLTINFRDEQGEPVEIKNPWDVAISFYRKLEEDEPSTPKDYWNDTTSGQRWRSIENESHAGNRAERLAPGVYRAFVIRRPAGGYELTDPIVLDGTQRETVIDLPKLPEASVVVNLVDEQFGKPVTGADVRIQSDDPQIPSYRYGSSEFPEARVELKDLLPGRHKIIAHRSAGRIGELEYAPAEGQVQLERGKTAELMLKLRGKLLPPEEMARRWPFTLEGKVVDGDGKPVAGATLTAYSGSRTLADMGQTTSDEDGRYVLRFGPGYWPPDGASFGAASVKVTKDDLFDRDAGTRKPFILSGGPEPPLEGRDGRTVLKVNTTHQLDFVMLPAVGVSVEVVDDVFKPLPEAKVLLRPSGAGEEKILLSGTTDAKGQIGMTGIEPHRAVQWTLPSNTPFESRSNPVLFTGPGKYRTRLEAYMDRATATRFLRVKEVIDPAGKDVTAEVVQDDPLLREPLSEELQASCRAMVAKMLEANRLWIEPSPADTVPYEFELHFDMAPQGQKSRIRYENTGPDSINPHATHGMTYVSQLAGLANPGNVVFRVLEITPQRTTLAYSFKKPVRVEAGNGVDNFWRGSTSSVSREGILVIDASRNVPLEVQGDALHERFDDYRLVDPGTYVPLRIQIDVLGHPDFAFDWQFHLYEPNVWMLDAARNPQAPDGPPIMTLDNLLIEGKPARRLDNLDDRRIPEPHETPKR
jgi:beta-lactamase regulating signal transducer with metallopeptidase domain